MKTESMSHADTAIAAIESLILAQKARAEAVVSDFSARRTAAAESHFAQRGRRDWWVLSIYIRVSAPHLFYLEWVRSHSGKGRKLIRTTLPVARATKEVRYRDLLRYTKEYEEDLVIAKEDALRPIRKKLSALVKIRAAIVRETAGPSDKERAQRASLASDDVEFLSDFLDDDAPPSRARDSHSSSSQPSASPLVDRPQLRNRE